MEETRYTIANFRCILRLIKQHQIRDTTKQKYYQAWIKPNKFLLKFKSLPDSWEEKLVLYATHLADTGKRKNTISSYISGIRHILRMDGVELNSTSVEIAAITRACKLTEEAVIIRLPIHKRLLVVLLDQLNLTFADQPYLRVLYRAMFTAGYYGLLRVGEMCTGDHPVLAKDVLTDDRKKKHFFLLRTSKTHNLRDKPQKITIPSLPEADEEKLLDRATLKFKHNYNPFVIIQEFIDCRLDRIQVTRSKDPFFVFSNKQPVTPVQLRRVLKKALEDKQYNSQAYDVHSFRGGRCEDLRRLKFSTERIRREGRWSEKS